MPSDLYLWYKSENYEKEYGKLGPNTESNGIRPISHFISHTCACWHSGHSCPCRLRCFYPDFFGKCLSLVHPVGIIDL